MTSFWDLYSLCRKSKKSLQTFHDLLNNKIDERPLLIRLFGPKSQPIINCWQFTLKQGTWANTLARIIVSFLLCHFVGILFYFTLTLKYAVNPEITGTYTSLAIQAILTGILLLPFLRVVILLAIPALLTSRLRTVLLVIIVSWSLQIPATNIVNNIRNTAEGVACVQERIKESSQEMRQLAGEKLKQMTQEKFNKFVEKAYQPFTKMRETIRELEDSANKMIAHQREMIKNVEGMLQSCEEFMRLPYYRCNAILEDMYYQCMDVTIDSLCLPIRLLKGICYSTRVLTLHCEWPKALKKQLEENVGTYVKEGLQQVVDEAKNTAYYGYYADAKDSINNTIESAKSVQMNITYEHTAKTNFDINLDRIKKKLRDEIATFEWFLKGPLPQLEKFPLFLHFH